MSSWFPYTNSNESVLYIINGSSMFIWKNVSSHGTTKGSLPIRLAMRPKEAIGSSTGTSRFFSGLGFRKGFYKIKNICIKLYVIYKYK